MTNFELFDFPTDSFSENFYLGQQLLGLKTNGNAFLEGVDGEKYGYKLNGVGGFTELTVNQLMWFAYQMGKEDGERVGHIKGNWERVEEFRKMMSAVMDELDMIPNEDCGNEF